MYLLSRSFTYQRGVKNYLQLKYIPYFIWASLMYDTNVCLSNISETFVNCSAIAGRTTNLIELLFGWSRNSSTHVCRERTNGDTYTTEISIVAISFALASHWSLPYGCNEESTNSIELWNILSLIRSFHFFILTPRDVMNSSMM